VKKVLLFVAIVWTVAATFLVFEAVFLKGTDLVRMNPGLSEWVGLSPATTESKACVVAPEEMTPSTRSGQGPSTRSGQGPSTSSGQGPSTSSGQARVSASDAAVGSWMLGQISGRDALTRQWAEMDRAALDRQVANMKQVADLLGVAAPEVFSPRQSGLANQEFVTFVERDHTGTAHQLAIAYSPEVCEIFKFGSLWGYSSVVRIRLPGEANIFGPEIRHHARAAHVPETLWQPMIDATPPDAETQQLASTVVAQSQAISSYLMGRR